MDSGPANSNSSIGCPASPPSFDEKKGPSSEKLKASPTAHWTRISCRIAVYVDKILRGAKPADLPAERRLTHRCAARVVALTTPRPPCLYLVTVRGGPARKQEAFDDACMWSFNR